jgi:phage gp29-like protein
MQSVIVGLDGKPLQREDKKKLTEEIANVTLTGVRNIWHDHSVASSLTPTRLAQVLRSANLGDLDEFLILAEEMEERDPHYGSVLSTRKLAVSSLPIQVEAAGESAEEQRHADEVRDIVSDPDFLACLKDFQDGLGKGYSVVEIGWETSAKQWLPTQFDWRDPRLFTMNTETFMELRLKVDDDPLGEPLAPFKFIVHQPKIKSGISIRGALGRLAAISYMCKSFALSDWMAFAEVFGMPIRVGKYHQSASEPEIATLRRAVASIGSDAAAIMPEKMAIELIERAGSGGDQFYKELSKFLDEQTSKAVLGQTMTTDNGSSMAQAEVHNEVRADIRDDDATQLANTLNRYLVIPYINLNYGVQKRYPRIKLEIAEPEDAEQLARTAQVLVGLGMRISEKGLLARTGMPEPEDENDVLKMPAATAPQPAEGGEEEQPQRAALNRQQALEIALNRQSDSVDDYADDFLEDWEPQMSDMVQPFIDALGDYDSLEAVRADLPNLVKKLDPTMLQELLARGLFAARASGDQTDD